MWLVPRLFGRVPRWGFARWLPAQRLPGKEPRMKSVRRRGGELRVNWARLGWVTVRSDTGAPALEKACSCELCGRTMRLEGSEPDARFTNLDNLKFVCECGHTSSRLVAHA